MNTLPLAQFHNTNLKELLIHRDNIPSLEFLLDSEGQKLQRLQKLKRGGKFDFGPRIKRRDLSSLFSEVKDEVDDFLDVSGIAMPKHGYFSLLKPSLESAKILGGYSTGSFLVYTGTYGLTGGIQTGSFLLTLASVLMISAGFRFIRCGALAYQTASDSRYKPSSQSITLAKTKRAILIPLIAHEYTHYAQNRKFKLTTGRHAFIEGHARGVERKISYSYREREDNEAFLYHISDETFGELKSAYLWICKELGFSPRKSLLKTKTFVDKDEAFNRSHEKEPTPHAIGNTLFYLYETQMGSGIYRDMFNGTFKLPEQ